MHVVATAGHVDHGKSTLVRALTGMEPDRWAEERRRGMTLDLGFAWTTLPTGQTVAFVDVPGHERFIGNMMAGVGPVPAALVVVAADEGWRAQTTEHVTVLDCLDVRHGLLVVTRADLADPEPVLADARARLERTSLAGLSSVAVSAVTGSGLSQLRAALGRLADELPPPVTDGRIRLFIDRAFTVRGSGTVVTGTLRSGTLRQEDRLLLTPSNTEVRVRGLQSLGEPEEIVPAVARVAVNLRGVPVEDVRRGDVLVTPQRWAPTTEVDVRLDAVDPSDIPGDLLLHIGSAAIPCRVRPLSEDTGRVRLASPLPLEPGDRAVLREPSTRLATGIVVLDVDPPALRRRGAALARAVELAGASGRPDAGTEVARRGWMTRSQLATLGILGVDEQPPAELVQVGDHLVDPATWSRWHDELFAAVDAYRDAAPLEPGLPMKAAQHTLDLPDSRLIAALVQDTAGKLRATGGRISRPGTGPTFSAAAQRALEGIQRRLEDDPLDAPEAGELASAGLTKGVLAAAASAGLLLRLPGEVILHPSAPAYAVETISRLDQPFTLSQARQALGTTRKVAVPLLEHLDAIGYTVRVDSTTRRVNPDRAPV